MSHIQIDKQHYLQWFWGGITLAFLGLLLKPFWLAMPLVFIGRGLLFVATLRFAGALRLGEWAWFLALATFLPLGEWLPFLFLLMRAHKLMDAHLL